MHPDDAADVSPQFETADYATPAGDVVPADSHARFVRALLFGAGGAVVGLALYATVAIVTGLVIGYVSVAVGYIVAKAMMKGSGGVGGRRYQVAAVLLTYAAVSMAAIPIAITASVREHRQKSAQTEGAQDQPGGHVSTSTQAQPRPTGFLPAVAMLAFIGLASPFLDLESPVNGLIGLVILFVGLRIAWTATAGRSLSIEVRSDM